MTPAFMTMAWSLDVGTLAWAAAAAAFAALSAHIRSTVAQAVARIDDKLDAIKDSIAELVTGVRLADERHAHLSAETRRIDDRLTAVERRVALKAAP